MKQLSIEELKEMSAFFKSNAMRKYAMAIDELISIREAQGAPVAYLIHEKAKPARLSFQNLKGFVSPEDIAEHELWQNELFSAPQLLVMPEGWQIAPKHVDTNMAKAGKMIDKRLDVWKCQDIYQAMLSAAPKPGGE